MIIHEENTTKSSIFSFLNFNIDCHTLIYVPIIYRKPREREKQETLYLKYLFR